MEYVNYLYRKEKVINMEFYKQERHNYTVNRDCVLKERYEKITKQSEEKLRLNCNMAGQCNTCMYCQLASDWDAIGEYNQYCKAAPKGTIAI